MNTQHQHGAGQYRKVFDARKRRVRGLWERNGSFYAQLSIPAPDTGANVVRRVRLEDKDGNPVSTVPQAIEVMNRLRVKRADETLRIDPKRTPTFGEYVTTYLHRLEVAKDTKRPATVRRERGSLRIACRTLGDLRLRQITSRVLRDYQTHRQAEGVSGRGVNIEVQVVRNLLKSAVHDGHLSTVPDVPRLNERVLKRRLLSHDEIERVCAAAVEVAPMTGGAVADFIKLMAYSGGRWGETLRLRWQDVDFDRKQLHFGADGLSKNGEARAVDFNERLEAHLRDMAGRKAPSAFLFPSQKAPTGEDLATTTFNKTIREARVKAKVPDFTCHLCRHYFISTAVMAGIDFMTISQWVGHRDGGILIGRVYGHLSAEHRRAQAGRLTFGPTLAVINE